MIRINLGERAYDVSVVSDDPGGLIPFITQRLPGQRHFIICDSHLAVTAHRLADQLIAIGCESTVEAVPSGEASKSIECVCTLWSRLATWPADRQSAVIAIGGGMIGDLAGFVAATYARGLPFLNIPTSLLAMVDSAIGGKVGINLPQGKNLVGAFHQPVGVWIDTAYLDSLPERELKSGLAEVIKHGVAFDTELFAWLEAHIDRVLARDASALRHIIERSVTIKGQVVAEDERETTGKRAGLNYGHTFAHAFETSNNYQGWTHGEAVAAGMVCAGRLAERLKMVDSDLTSRQTRLIERSGLPTSLPAGNVDEWLAIMRRDKKAVAGQLRFVLPSRIGSVELVDGVAESDVRSVLS